MTQTHDEPFLHESILLLALHDEKGTVQTGSMYTYALAGAMLGELLLRRRIAVGGTRGKKLVEVVDAAPVGEPLLDEALRRIRTAKKRASLQTWLSRLAGLQDLRHRVARQLCRRGILRADEDQILFIFERRIYPEVDPGPERRLIARMREAIFTDAPDPDPEAVILVSLASAADLLEGVFDREELKARRARLEQLTSGELVGGAVREAVEAVQVMIAVLPAIMAATTVASAGC